MICPQCSWLAPFGGFRESTAHKYIEHLSKKHKVCRTCRTSLVYIVTTRAKRISARDRARNAPNFSSSAGNGWSGWRSIVVQDFLIGSNDIEWWVKKRASTMGM